MKKRSTLRDRLRSLKIAGAAPDSHTTRVKIVPSPEEAKEILESLLENEVYSATSAFRARYGISAIIATEPGKVSLPVIRINRDQGCFEYLGNPLMVGTEIATCHDYQLVRADGKSMLLDRDGDQVKFTFFKSNKDKKAGQAFVAKSLRHRSAKGKLSLSFNGNGWVLKVCPAAIEEWVLGCDIQGGGHKLTLPKGVARGEPWGLQYVDFEESDDDIEPPEMSNPS